MSIGGTAWATGASSSAASRAKKMVRRIDKVTLAALSSAGAERARHSFGPGSGCVRRRRRAPGGAQTAPQRGIGVQAREGLAERARVAGRDDQAGSLVLHEAARGGSHCVCGD